MRRGIQVFLKFPEAGQVKTRLAADLGEEAATRAYETMVCRVLESCRRAHPDLISIAYAPAARGGEVKQWLEPWLKASPAGISWIGQKGGDLGERMEHATAAFLEKREDLALCVVGADCVDLGPDLFEEAWRRLEKGHDLVFGPATDGGYYLLGCRESYGFLFRGIPWSSEKTLAATLTAAEENGMPVSLLPERVDIDTGREWEEFSSTLGPRPCVFFDRDGVVNRSPGPGYVLSAEDFHLNEGIAGALRVVQEKGALAILVTSQKGVGKGLMTASDLDGIHRKMQRQLREEAGVEFDGIYAFTGEEDCLHRPKPDPEMILTASEEFSIDPGQSWMIGDADRDIVMGKAAGLRGTIRIRTDKPIGEPADFTLGDSSEITGIISKLL